MSIEKALKQIELEKTFDGMPATDHGRIVNAKLDRIKSALLESEEMDEEMDYKRRVAEQESILAGAELTIMDQDAQISELQKLVSDGKLQDIQELMRERSVLQKICARRADMLESIGFYPDSDSNDQPLDVGFLREMSAAIYGVEEKKGCWRGNVENAMGTKERAELQQYLESKLTSHLKQIINKVYIKQLLPHLVQIANYAMMLWYLLQKMNEDMND